MLGASRAGQTERRPRSRRRRRLPARRVFADRAVVGQSRLRLEAAQGGWLSLVERSFPQVFFAVRRRAYRPLPRVRQVLRDTVRRPYGGKRVLGGRSLIGTVRRAGKDVRQDARHSGGSGRAGRQRARDVPYRGLSWHESPAIRVRFGREQRVSASQLHGRQLRGVYGHARQRHAHGRHILDGRGA